MALRQHGRRAEPMTSFNLSIGANLGLLTCRLRTLSWWRSRAFSTTNSFRGRHASAAIPTSSLPELRTSSFDHNRRAARRAHAVIREIESKVISAFDHETE
jgi:hypothetical protein